MGAMSVVIWAVTESSSTEGTRLNSSHRTRCRRGGGALDSASRTATEPPARTSCVPVSTRSTSSTTAPPLQARAWASSDSNGSKSNGYENRPARLPALLAANNG